MTVGSTVVKPGQATNFTFPYSMHPGMGGKHHFEVHIGTNDPKRPELVFHVYANSIDQPKASATPAAVSPTPVAGGFMEWTAQGLAAGMSQKNFTLINVHTPFEGRIRGTDLEIPYDQIDQALDKLPKAKDAPIVLYCSSGRMSEIAAKRLVELGYTKVVHLKGGMVAWKQAGYQLETK